MGKSLGTVLLTIVLALVGVLWFTQRGPRDVPEVAPPGVAPTIAMPEAASNLAEPLRAAGEQRAELEAQPAEVAPTPPSARERAAGVLESSDEKETGSIHVTVLGPLGKPVPSAALQVTGVPSGRPTPRYIRATTDSRGNADISSVALGPVRVTARTGSLAVGTSDTVRLTAAQPKAVVVIRLTFGGSVVGELMDIHGEPAAGTPMVLHLRVWPGRASDPGTSNLQMTNAGDDGSFRFDHLAPGAYILHTRAEGSRRKLVPYRMLELKVFEGQTTVAVFEDLQGSYVQLSGLVLRDGAPVEGASVSIGWADRSRGYLGRKAKTDSEGRFEVTLDEPGGYQFQVSERSRNGSIFHTATIPAVPTYDLVIAYSTGRISGRVLGPNGRPEPGVAIMALGRQDGEAGGSTISMTTSDSNGRYEFAQLLTATYRIMAGRSELPARSQTQANPFLGGAQVSDLRLEPGDDLTVADLHLPAAAALEVVITDHDGNPVASAEVQCGLPESHSHHEMLNGRSDETGLCRFDGVTPGDYRMRAVWERTVSPWSQVSMIANETARGVLVLEPGTMVTIEVQDGGSQVERCYVSIEDATGYIVTSSILKDGATVLGPLATGTYKVVARMLSGGQQAERTISVAGEPNQAVQLTLQ